MTTYEIREIESKRLREYLQTLSTTEHRFFVSDVMEKCGRQMSKKTFYNWKYGGSGVIPWQSYPKMIDKRYMKNGRSDTPCS